MIERGKQGDRVANEKLLARLRCIPRIVTALNARAGAPLGTADLADLAQDVYLLVWRKRGDFDARASLESWLYGIARFEFLNALRRRRPTSEPRDIAAAIPEFDDDLPLDPDSVRAALADLEPEEIEAVRLRHFEGLSFPESARRAGVPLGTLKNRYYKALERLHTRLEPSRRSATR